VNENYEERFDDSDIIGETETPPENFDTFEEEDYEAGSEDFGDCALSEVNADSAEEEIEVAEKYDDCAVLKYEPYRHLNSSEKPEEFEHNSVPGYNRENFENGYKYRTEDNEARREAGFYARIVRTEGWVKPKSVSERNIKAQKETPDKIRDEVTGKSKDDAGHLNAHGEGGADERGNLVAMDAQLNRHGEWRQMERRCESETSKGNSVYRTIDVHYPDDVTARPDYFNVSCMVYDKEGNHLFTFSEKMNNTDKESRDNLINEAVEENENRLKEEELLKEERSRENRRLAEQFGNVED